MINFLRGNYCLNVFCIVLKLCFLQSIFNNEVCQSACITIKNPNILVLHLGKVLLFICFDSLHPSQQFFSHVGTSLPGLNQYEAVDKVSCSRTQPSDSTGCEARTNNPLIPSLTLYQLNHCAPHLGNVHFAD